MDGRTAGQRVAVTEWSADFREVTAKIGVNKKYKGPELIQRPNPLC